MSGVREENQKRIVAIFAERSKLTKTQIDRKWKRKNWWLDSDEWYEARIGGRNR